METDIAAVRAILDTNNLAGVYVTDVAVFEDDDRIHSLDLSHRGISALPASIGELGALAELYLDSNLLTELPDEIANLKLLERFDISFNRIALLPEAIVSMSIMIPYEYCSGLCHESNCCTINYHNGLQVHHNRICSVSDTLRAWLVQHDKAWDSTQECSNDIP